ncbi:MAG: formate dehydrogenase accessory protein FdhE [Acetobacteraceae bacterium]|nr:formate dehydrogenase accessory protein FdhE [Acetobacteraceae bacterium]
MGKSRIQKFEPISIGEVAAPPFVYLPKPEEIFTARAERLRALAKDHGLAPYLTFLADLCETQARIQQELPELEWPSTDAVARALAFGMPPLNRGDFRFDDSFAEAFSRLISAWDGIAMPDSARLALRRLQNADRAARQAMVRNVLENTIPADAMAEHAFLAAGLQVHFVRSAAKLDASRIKPHGEGVCPVCGSSPVASLIVGFIGAHGTRFCACPLCGTLWNYVRIKCTLCGGTKGIAYHGLEGDAGLVKAETCDTCRGYVKILYQHKNPALDPLADDVASLGLDLLLRDAGYHRGAVNPFLFGY